MAPLFGALGPLPFRGEPAGGETNAGPMVLAALGLLALVAASGSLLSLAARTARPARRA